MEEWNSPWCWGRTAVWSSSVWMLLRKMRYNRFLGSLMNLDRGQALWHFSCWHATSKWAENTLYTQEASSTQHWMPFWNWVPHCPLKFGLKCAWLKVGRKRVPPVRAKHRCRYWFKTSDVSWNSITQWLRSEIHGKCIKVYISEVNKWFNPSVTQL